MDQNAALRAHIAKALDWEDAQRFLVGDCRPNCEGRPAGLPYSPCFIEHLRLTQHDILISLQPGMPSGGPKDSAADRRAALAGRLDESVAGFTASVTR
jgi:hypothetical protein